MEKEKQQKINTSLSKLEEIVGWFEQQKNVDVEEGIKRVKEGAVIIKDLRARLKKVENEFEEVKKSLGGLEEK